jgi:UDP-N-acetylmuramate--alanine ligase
VTIYCSGIGGIGLSAYACLQKARGHRVLGSDRTESALTRQLESDGITVTTVQDGSMVPADADLFVYSEAIAPDAPERVAAQRHGIRSVPYAQALGELLADKRLIAVCGTHGKSSTTAMTAQVLVDAGLDPTVVVGTKVPFLDGRNWRTGGSDLALAEACEYKRSFHHFRPSIILMTSVDGDHFDDYSSIEEYRAAFVEFLRLLPPDGIVITHGADDACRDVVAAAGRTMIDADTMAEPAVGVPGAHMRSNARLVVALAGALGIPDANARASLQRFAGTWRRMEIKGTRADGVTVIDDYGHHPAEIRATLAAMREAYPGRRIVCVFQPHTHDRTIKLHEEFASAFKDADVVIVTDVYEARAFLDAQKADVPALVQAIATHSKRPTQYSGSLDAVQALLSSSDILMPGDILFCTGAGDITGLAGRMIQ